MITVLYGSDEFSVYEEAGRLAAEELPPDVADLNTTRLGADASVEELRFACETAPFLAPHRVALVDGLLTRVTRPAGGVRLRRTGRRRRAASDAVQALAAYLPSVPTRARLIFTEVVAAERSSRRRAVPSFLRGPLGKALKEHATVTEFAVPRGPALVRWLRQRARTLGGNLLPDAADLLALVSDGDLRSLDQELRKLVTYAGPNRSVTAEDVRALVHEAVQADIFAFGDALATGQQRRALKQLETFLTRGERPEYLLGMIARQVRLLNQAKALAQEGTPISEFPAALGLHPFPARKVAEQARRYDARTLVAMHHAVLDADVRLKTGQLSPALALELLTVKLVSYGPRQQTSGRIGRRGS